MIDNNRECNQPKEEKLISNHKYLFDFIKACDPDGNDNNANFLSLIVSNSKNKELLYPSLLIYLKNLLSDKRAVLAAASAIANGNSDLETELCSLATYNCNIGRDFLPFLEKYGKRMIEADVIYTPVETAANKYAKTIEKIYPKEPNLFIFYKNKAINGISILSKKPYSPEQKNIFLLHNILNVMTAQKIVDHETAVMIKK